MEYRIIKKGIEIVSDPESLLLWTGKSVRNMQELLRERGDKVSHPNVKTMPFLIVFISLFLSFQAWGQDLDSAIDQFMPFIHALHNFSRQIPQ
ncbi:MAG: hypothetical protein LBK97_01285, partial [Prevotellaceae bacterium]|nr:hypothetical protein [Prevotellaceae bacterium]